MESNVPFSTRDPRVESSELRRSVSKATERIHEIINAAEQVAIEIRAEAETQAEAYREQSRRDAERMAEDRLGSLEQALATVVEIADGFKREADRMVGELNEAVEQARSQMAAPLPSGLDAASEPEPEPDEDERSANEPPRLTIPVAAYPGAETRNPGATPANSGDETAEALIRATQMAVSGEDREMIERTLRSDFDSVDPEPILNEILGRP